MSFILDALKKSEAERQRQAGPALLEMRVVRPARRWPLWGTIVLVLLLANGAVLTWLALRHTPETAAPAAASGGAAISGVAVNGAAANAAVTSGAAPPASDAAIAPAGGATPAPATAAALPPAVAPVSAGSGPAMTAADNTVEQSRNPADYAPAVADGGAGASGAQYGSTGEPPAYETISGHLPELQLNLHVFADNPAERYALINMHKVHEGDVTPEGVRVERITQKGVVMEYRGSEFLLGK